MNSMCDRVVERANRCCLAVCLPPVKEACAELLATFVLVLLGDCVMASCVLGRLQENSILVGAFGWGLALMVAVAIAGGVSGGHVNPAVTLSLATTRKCGWQHVIPNIFAQYTGSFLAAYAVYATYKDAIDEYDDGHRHLPPHSNSTAQIFATYPHDSASLATCIWDQVLGSALLLIVICAAIDTKNLRLPPHIQPVVIGLGLTVISLALGFNCGAPLNPARDLGPRFFTAITGWGFDVFSYRNYQWFWIPVVAPHIGGIAGAWLYKLLIELPSTSYHIFLDEIEQLEKVVAGTSGIVTKPSIDKSTSSDLTAKVCLDRPLLPGPTPTSSKDVTFRPIEPEFSSFFIPPFVKKGATSMPIEPEVIKPLPMPPHVDLVQVEKRTEDPASSKDSTSIPIEPEVKSLPMPPSVNLDLVGKRADDPASSKEVTPMPIEPEVKVLAMPPYVKLGLVDKSVQDKTTS